MSKVYAELALTMHARRGGYGLALARLGIVYGPSPVEHEAPESQTVIDKFRRLAADGRELTLDGGGRATIGAVHVADAARILLDCPVGDPVAAYDVAAETLTVADVAALAEGRAPAGGAAWSVARGFEYEHDVAGYLGARGMRLLVTGATGYLGWRAADAAGRARARRARALAARLRAPRALGGPAGGARRRRRPRRPRRCWPGATSSCTSPACPTPRAPAPIRRARCARTRARPPTCSTAASSTAAR